MIRPTSRIANRKRSRITAAEARGLIVHFLRLRGPETRDYIATYTGLLGDTVRPRVLELIKAGKIRVLKKRGRTRLGNEAELLAVVR